jgi:hypothetical protein
MIKTSFGLSSTKKHPYYLHDAMQFITSHITKIGTRKAIWQCHMLKKIRHSLEKMKNSDE